MKTKMVTVSNDVHLPSNFWNIQGKRIEVTEQIDNFGDHTITDQPKLKYMFIPAKFCLPLILLLMFGMSAAGINF